MLGFNLLINLHTYCNSFIYWRPSCNGFTKKLAILKIFKKIRPFFWNIEPKIKRTIPECKNIFSQELLKYLNPFAWYLDHRRRHRHTKTRKIGIFFRKSKKRDFFGLVKTIFNGRTLYCKNKGIKFKYPP